MNDNKKVGFAIYGCGNISRVHACALLEIEEAELVGAADVNRDSAVAFSEKYGVRVFSDYRELLLCNEVDAVCICTPSGTHADLAIEALHSGKHVVLEKPMALTCEECDRIIEACRQSGCKLTVISQLRTSPDVQRAIRIIKSGALGKITFAEVRMKYYRAPEYFIGSWRGTVKMDGGGALMNQGIHGVDLLLYLCGDVRRVQSSVRTLFHDIEVEDTAAALLEFESGALGVIEATTSVYPGFDRVLEICGSEGSLILKEGNIERITTKDGSIDEYNTLARGANASDATKTEIDGHKAQISDFIKVILGDTEIEYCDEHQGNL